MDDLRRLALEDDFDDEIEAAAHAVRDDDVSHDDDGSTGVLEADPDPMAALARQTNADQVFRTLPNIFSEGSTTRGDQGDVYRTSPSLFGDHLVTQGPDGTSQTYDNVFSEGHITYGPDGVTYRTNAKIFGPGTVTRGSDGSVYETTPNLTDNGSTTRRTN